MPDEPRADRRNAFEVFGAFLRLGLTSFGGPVAHLGYFQPDLVRRRRWVSDETFAQIVALCQFLPGPASSQAGILLGWGRAGFLGAVLAWLAFTLPSAAILTAFALGISGVASIADAPWLHGLLLAAVAVVALAVINMYRTLCPDNGRKLLAFAATAVILLLPQNGISQLAMIAVGAIFGLFFIRADERAAPANIPALKRSVGIVAASVFVALVIALPIAAQKMPASPVAVFAAFFEAGALVFGGGHVMLPLLQARVVPPGWVSAKIFLAGYGATQAMPGPLSTFAAYLGASMHGPVAGIGGAALALFAIYAPSFLLLAAIVPFWPALVRSRRVLSAVAGVNAAVVGVLLAALYSPVWTTSVLHSSDAAIAIAAFGLLSVLEAPPWTVVVFAALAAQLIALT